MSRGRLYCTVASHQSDQTGDVRRQTSNISTVIGATAVSIIDVKKRFLRFFILVTFYVFNVFLLFRSTFKITATKFNAFINNRILYPVIRTYETMNSTILNISLLA